jgi:uncharacterized membrane protein YhaH (DUF805 family)
MNWYLKVLKQYADFNGRARRQEFWMFVLFNFIISFALSLLEGMVGLKMGQFGIISSLYSLLVLVPSIAVGARRLHDINKTGWLQLLWFIPIIGWIWLIVLHVTEGNKGDNPYGPDPKA